MVFIYVLGLFLVPYILYFVGKKMGWFDWLRTTYVYQTKTCKLIIFVLKVYIYPVRMDVKKDKSEVVKLGKTYRWISSINMIAFVAIFSVGVWIPFEYSELSSLQRGELHLATGEVHRVIKIKPRTSLNKWGQCQCQ